MTSRQVAKPDVCNFFLISSIFRYVHLIPLTGQPAVCPLISFLNVLYSLLQDTSLDLRPPPLRRIRLLRKFFFRTLPNPLLWSLERPQARSICRRYLRDQAFWLLLRRSDADPFHSGFRTCSACHLLLRHCTVFVVAFLSSGKFNTFSKIGKLFTTRCLVHWNLNKFILWADKKPSR